jgi:hypothetical protein
MRRPDAGRARSDQHDACADCAAIALAAAAAMK